jgi:hypothetical protein
MAQKLDEMGESYKPPVMIDPQPNAYRMVLEGQVIEAFKKAANNQKLHVHKTNLAESDLRKKFSYLIKKSKTRIVNITKEKVLFALVGARERVDISIPSILRTVENCNMVAHKRYSRNLEQSFDSDVEIILSKPLTAKFSQDPEKDWLGFTNGKMNVHLVDDDGVIMSGAMFEEPYVDKLANILNNILTKESETHDNSSTGKSTLEFRKPKRDAITSAL